MTREHAAVLVLPCGQVEVLPKGTDPSDALDQGPLYSTHLPPGKLLYWCTGSSIAGQVNGFASQIVGHAVSGDVCIVDTHPASELASWLDRVEPARYSLVVQPRKPGLAAQAQVPAELHHDILTQQALVSSQHTRAVPATPDASKMSAKGAASTQHSSRPGDHISPHQPSKQFLLNSRGSEDCHTPDPRQALLWAIAGRATSLSWSNSASDSTTAAPTVGLANPGTTLKSHPIENLNPTGNHQDPTCSPRSWIADLMKSPAPQELPASDCVLQQSKVQHSQSPSTTITAGQSGSPAGQTCSAVSHVVPAHHGYFSGDIHRRHGMTSSSTEVASGPAWVDLGGELLGLVLRCFAQDPTSAVAMSGVCRKWRHSLMLERQQLMQLTFTMNSAYPLKCHGRAIPSNLLCRMQCPPLPLLMHTAARNGNCSACVALASALDGQGCSEEAMRYWKRAARHGHPTAQIKLGMAHYKGTCGVPRDPEEALLWLSRGAKLMLGTHSGPWLSFAALVLGYLHLDGEATRIDIAEAVKWFKVSAKCGSKEAENVLGTMFNTGQYG